jgi:hypothetical protein
MQTVQAIQPDDKPHCFQFAKDILSIFKYDENYLGDGNSAMKECFTYRGEQTVKWNIWGS